MEVPSTGRLIGAPLCESPSRWVVTCALVLIAACAGPDARNGTAVPDDPDSTKRLNAEQAQSSAVAEGPLHQSQPTLLAPRRASMVDLVPLWTAGGPSQPGRMIQPVALFASRLGVLVSDLDGAQIRSFDSRSGIQTRTIGGYGLGPGEFGRVPVLLGTYNEPLAFEGPNGRISLLRQDSAPTTLRVATGRSWTTACQTSPGRVLLQSIGWDKDGYFTSTIGADAILVDSLPYPIPSLLAVLPLGRQAPLVQVDDSTCVVLPSYAHEFAVVRGGRVTLGSSVEILPTPRVEWSGEVGRSTLSLSRGTRLSQLGAAAWDGRLLILFAGATEHRRRVVDIYDVDFSYQGSFVLPFASEFIAASGDTLFALGEQDDEPILAAFLLRPR